MGSLLRNVAILSGDVARVLVGLGLGLGFDTQVAGATSSGVGRYTATPNPATGMPFPPLAIIACTGIGVPIVITTAYPHGVSNRGVGGMSCIISGVTGNTAANNIATNPNDRTVGLNQGVLAVPLTATTLALYGQDQNSEGDTPGVLIPLVGDGDYTSGGTVTPALTDGAILLGRDTIREHSSPPRIVMIPRSSKWSAKSVSMPIFRQAEQRSERSQRSDRTEMVAFDVACWGQATPPNPAADYDIARALAHAVITSGTLIFGATEMIGDGVWDDEKERATQQIKAGHLFTFGVSIAMPVLDSALPFVPGSAVFAPTTHMQVPETGVTELGCSG